MNNVLPFPSSRDEPLRWAPPDVAVREEALDIRRSFIVQAPAGSGKTGLLIQRYLKLLADESVTRPEQVLAITFTNAATAEMRERVLQVLWRASEVAVPAIQAPLELAASAPQEATGFDELSVALGCNVIQRDIALGWQLLAHPNRLNIRTIDSVCAEIARTLPVRSGSGGRLAPVEDAAALYSEAARRTLLHLGGDDRAFNAALRNLLLHRDGNLADCEALLADMLALREQWGELVPLRQRELDDAWLDANLLPRLEHALQQAIASTLARLRALLPADLLNELASLAGDLGHLPGTNGEPSPIACCAGEHDAPDASASHLERWRALIHVLLTAGGDWRNSLAAHYLGFDIGKAHPCRARLAAVLDRLRGRDDLLEAMRDIRQLPAARYPANQWAVAKSLFRVLNRALLELQITFAERGQCDFAELGLLARSALDSEQGATDLARAAGARLQHLLVDEMQDTSTGQYDLLELLTASWDGHSQTVFLVGDPHQSIYLFRQARVERFVHALETGRLGEISLTRLALTANFRSQSELVSQFNEDFGSIFPAVPEAGGGALHFVRADATRPRSPSSAGRVWHANPQRGSAARAPLVVTQARRDADFIAKTAAEWLARPVPEEHNGPWRIAVLVRSRNHLAEVIPALRREGVAFRAVDIEPLHERQEILDLTALTRALLHPGDRVAALAVLRAPWCGLSLAELHLLAGEDDFSLRYSAILPALEQRAHLLSADSRQRLARVHRVLRAAVEKRARNTVAQLVERAWRSLGGDAPLTPAELTNARRFFELLDSLEGSNGHVERTQLEASLKQLYAEPETIARNSGCVELLTIHKAKGVEWDVVFIPGLERPPAGSPARLLTWSVLDDVSTEEAAPIMLAPIAARGEDVDCLTRWLTRRQAAREYAENRRLFYVACTRAREELHLFAAPSANAGGVSSGPPDSLLKAAWPVAAPHFSSYIPNISNAADAVTGPGANELQRAAPSTDAADEIDDNLLAPHHPVIRRLPATFDPSARLAGDGPQRRIFSPSSTDVEQRAFARPEGSFGARALGNAVHACIELLTSRTAAGASPAALLAEIPSWSGRIATLLRADGLPPAAVWRLARDARAMIENLLRDPEGQWLIGPHLEAGAEISITTASRGVMTTVRADRIFVAGPEPRLTGSASLWIVDYKTSSPTGGSIEAFLAAQRAAYAAQLEAYARALAPAQSVAANNVRLALYFPALKTASRLLWWAPEGEHSLAELAEFELRAEN